VSPKERSILLVAVALLIMAIFLGQGLLGLKQKQGELKEMVVRQSRKVERLKLAYDIPALERKLADLKDEWVLTNPFPQGSPSPQVELFIEKSATDSGVSVVSFRRGETKPYKLENLEYQAHRRSIQAKGDLAYLLLFLHYLERAPFPLLLDNIALTPAERGWELSCDILVLGLK